jgi:hypothetical protein
MSPRATGGSRRWKLADQRGVALVEFALVLPLILLLLFGMIDFGKAFNYWNDETHLANEAARFAVVNNSPTKNPDGTPTAGSLIPAIRDQADSSELKNGGTGSVSSPGIKICIYFPNAPSGSAPPPTAYAVGQPLKVVVTAEYNWLGYLIGQTSMQPHTGLTGTATMRIEKAPTDPTNAAGPDAYRSSPTNSCD